MGLNEMATLPEAARMIFAGALADCNVAEATARHIGSGDGTLRLGEEVLDAASLRRIRIVAAGKAANAMLQGAWRQLSSLPALQGRDIAGVVISPELPQPLPDGFRYFPGGHPSPNEASFSGARAALAMLREAAENIAASNTLSLFLISGGSSAMMELPLDPAISLADTREFHRALVASGASIAEINCVRKHFSAVKGGRLALAAEGTLCRTLLVSDVPAGQQDALGSGPTLADVSTVTACREILARYGLTARFPAAVRRFFEAATLLETPKPGELSAQFHVLLDAQDLARAAARRAEALGWTTTIDNRCDEWEYRDAAQFLLERLRSLRRDHARVCLLSVGEVAVPLPENTPGRGGRNQQFALYAATLLTPADGAVAILSAGSDGIDGNSPAAGAVVDRSSAGETPEERSAAVRALENFDAYPFLAAHNATIMTGPSGNNLRDLRVLLAET